MWKPDENLDDYTVTPAPEVTSDPPSAVTLRRTGEVEILKPIAHLKVDPKRTRTVIRAFGSRPPNQPLWFRRFLTVGSGALVMIGFVLVSAILLGMNDPVAGPEVVTIGVADDALVPSEEPFSLDLDFLEPVPETGRVDIVRSNTKRRSARPATHVTGNKPRRHSLQIAQPKFVPTTLVIYAENGVINTRIEPWLQTDKKTDTFSN